jgi:putative ABC transport system permease protein
MSQLFLIAYRNLVQHGRRTLMLGGAIAGVTALLVFLTCLSAGVGQTLLTSALTLSTGHITVGGFYKVTAGQSAPLVTDDSKVQAVVEKALPDIDYIASRGRGWGRLVSDQGNIQSGIAGVDMAHEPGLPKVIHMLEGNLNDLSKPGTILLFEFQAKKLKVKTGDSIVISVQTPRGVNNTVDVRVIGIAAEMGMLSYFTVLVPQDTIRQLYQLNADSTGALLVYLKDMKRIPQDIDILRKALTAAGYTVMDREAKAFWFKMVSINDQDWTGQRLDLTSWDDEISFISWTLKAIDGITFMLTAVLLVIIAIGIMNTLWIAIRERTREIGTLRAVGMDKSLVAAMFVIEAFLLGALGTLAGVGLGCLAAAFLNTLHLPVPKGAQMFLMSETLKFAFEPVRIFKDAALITACTTLISLIPSTKAASMRPVTAMSHVG